MHKSIARTLLVGGLVFTSLVGQVGAVVTDPRDIQDSKFREHIENLIAGNVVSGYSDGTFRPSEPVTRGQMAKFIVNGFNLGADGNIQQFGDVPSTNPFFAYINILKTEGIISGYSDGTYRPNAYVTRGETAKFIHNALKRSGVQGTEVGSGVMSDFPDVTGSNVFKDSIIYLSREKIINGFSDGTFKPNNNVTRGEMAKMVDGARNKMIIENAINLNRETNKYKSVDVQGHFCWDKYLIDYNSSSMFTVEKKSDSTCRSIAFKKIEFTNNSYRHTLDGSTWIDGLPSNENNTAYFDINNLIERNKPSVNMPSEPISFISRQASGGFGMYRDRVSIVNEVVSQLTLNTLYGNEYANFQVGNGPFYKLERIKGGEVCLNTFNPYLMSEGECSMSVWFFDKSGKLVAYTPSSGLDVVNSKIYFYE
jgi:hypothetical protein